MWPLRRREPTFAELVVEWMDPRSGRPKMDCPQAGPEVERQQRLLDELRALKKAGWRLVPEGRR